MKSIDLTNIDLFRARHSLVLAAQAYAQSTRQIPKEKIRQRIEELKYLSAQKKVPRLSMRKEILHLEELLHSVLNVEHALQKQERRESEKIILLKKQNEFLRKRLAASDDKDLQRKVDRLSHLLAEVVSRQEIKQDVALGREIARVLPHQAVKDGPSSLVELEQRLEYLKGFLEKKKVGGANGGIIPLLEQRIAQVEERIQQLKEGKQEQQPVRHTLLFQSSPSSALPMPSVPKNR